MPKFPRPDADHVLFVLGWVIAAPLWAMGLMGTLPQWCETVYIFRGHYIIWHPEVMAWTAPVACLCWCAAAVARFFKPTPPRRKVIRRIFLSLLNIVMVCVMALSLLLGFLTAMTRPDGLEGSSEVSASGCRVLARIEYDFHARMSGKFLLMVPGEHQLRETDVGFSDYGRDAVRERRWRMRWSGDTAQMEPARDQVVVSHRTGRPILCPTR